MAGPVFAQPILGRFISQRTAYQRTVFLNGSIRDRKVKPSGSWTYEKPIVVLVGRWTGSMGEGMAIGFDGMGRGTVMGSDMAGLAGGTEAIKLKVTGLELRLPTYDLRHLDDTPRHNWKPAILSIADNGDQEDLLLQKAILELEKKHE
ncbi:MAG: S41 family peptidase [Pseudomonadota bacterium]